MSAAPTARPRRFRLRGSGLVAALVLATLLGSAALLAQGELSARIRAGAQARSLAALAEARAALLGYAVSYAERHPGQGYAYLPCPDAANTGSTTISACGARDLGRIGRLPYRTLGLADLRDGWGECLWYAVAGSVKHNPKAQALNWDSPGQFALFTADGLPLGDAADDALAVAVLFAPGPPLPAQQRPQAGVGRCAGSDSAAIDLPAFVDDELPESPGATIAIRQGRPGSEHRNDVLAWIGIDDIFDALRRRSDHALRIEQIGVRAALALGARLDEPGFIASHADATAGSLLTGPLPPAATLGLSGEMADDHDNWRDQFRFAACADGTACISATLDDPPAVEPCRAVLLFGGERIRSGSERQRRDSPSRRADPAQYFEGSNAANFASGLPAFAGARRFAVHDPAQPASRDVIRCLG